MAAIDDFPTQQMIEQALLVRQRAYAPYSQFLVGACLVSEEGQFYSGANVENSSYGLTICAERAAAVAAVSQGDTNFHAIAIAAEGAPSPCGACRQFLNEFNRNLTVILVDASNTKLVRVTSLAELLPDSFHLREK